MEKFIPYDKLSKKARRELDARRRGTWGGLNPVTRTPPNPKAYDRNKAKRRKYDDSDSSPCFLCRRPKSGHSCASRSLAMLLALRRRRGMAESVSVFGVMPCYSVDTGNRREFPRFLSFGVYGIIKMRFGSFANLNCRKGVLTMGNTALAFLRRFLCVLLVLACVLSLSGTVFAADGGWQQIDGNWYYFYSSGKMATGWIKPSSAWYYMNADGTMATGWIESGGARYYLRSSGAMATGWQEIDGNWYYFYGSGKMATGWIRPSSAWYYMNADGTMATGWIESGGAGYYLRSSGAMATGWQEIDGKWYYFSSSGAAYRNEWLKSGLQWYYFGNDCTMIADTSEDINGSICKFDAKGRWISPLQQMLEATQTAKITTQIILVVDHNLTFWEKDASGLWVKRMDTYCGYGKNGLTIASSRIAGSMTTPIGAFPITLAFGTVANPGTSMTYRRITYNSYWSEENNSTYNTWVESSTPISGEHLMDYYQYKYALAIGFNINPAVYGRGSAIFLHCKSTDHWYTAGCVSAQESDVLSLMKEVENGAYIIIVPDTSALASY